MTIRNNLIMTTFNSTVLLSTYCLNKGDIGILRITSENVSEYSTIQIEVFDVGSLNPTLKLSFGRSAKVIEKHVYEIALDTGNLNKGIYEIKLIKFHSTSNKGLLEQKNFISGINFERIFFEVIEGKDCSPGHKNLNEWVTKKEKEIEDHFYSGVEVMSGSKLSFTSITFIKGLLTSKRIRFDRYEILPFRGLDLTDENTLVNEFFEIQKDFGLKFNYEDEVKKKARRDNPVTILYFPKLIAPDENAVLDFCNKKVQSLLLAMSLARGANGELFDTIIYNNQTKQASKFSYALNYIGNILTGNLSGENYESISNYVKGIESNSFLTFLVSLHKEAIAERNPNFKYVRYWQILETLSESKNFDESEDLLDFEEKPIKNRDGKNKKVKGSVGSIYKLIKDHKIKVGMAESNPHDGKDPITLWEMVNYWHALRNAVAHFGSIAEYGRLTGTRDAAEKAMSIIASQSIDIFLFELKEEVKLLLMTELLS